MQRLAVVRTIDSRMLARFYAQRGCFLLCAFGGISALPSTMHLCRAESMLIDAVHMTALSAYHLLMFLRALSTESDLSFLVTAMIRPK